MKKILSLILLTIPNIAMSYETAKYEVVKVISDKIEIREYTHMTLATISTDDKSQNNNFRTLFKFISGDNEQEQEISMTTPVFRQNIRNKRSMSFVMPDRFSKGSIPKPNNKDIKIKLLENAKFIVIRFSGRSVDRNFNKYQKALERAVEENALKADLKNPINAYYNAPWTIPFLKRNEVLFRLNQ
jgi:hypothetical protein